MMPVFSGPTHQEENAKTLALEVITEEAEDFDVQDDTQEDKQRWERAVPRTSRGKKWFRGYIGESKKRIKRRR